MLLNLRALANSNMTEYEMGKTMTLHFAAQSRPNHDMTGLTGLATSDFTATGIPMEEQVNDEEPKLSIDHEPKV